MVNVSSLAGVRSSGTGVIYAMTKAAMVHMSKALACEWAAYGIRVNCVAPWMARTPMLEAAFVRKTAVVEALLEAGSDINATSHSGRTALMYTAQNGDAATLRVLAEHGADLQLRNKDGKSALDLAANDEVKEQLLAAGAQA